MIAIGGDDLVALFDRQLHADDDSFLADVEVAEAADQAHPIELTRLLLEPADQEHLPKGLDFLGGGHRGRCPGSGAIAGSDLLFLGLEGLRRGGHYSLLLQPNLLSANSKAAPRRAVHALPAGGETLFSFG